MPPSRLRALPTLPVAAAIGISLHALWLLLPFPALRETPPPAPLALTAYSRPIARVWTPVLFSLPSAVGFSGETLATPLSSRPPLESPLDLSLTPPLRTLDWFEPQALPPHLPPRRLAPLTAVLPPPPPLPSPTGYRWRLHPAEDGAPTFQSFRPPRIPLPARPLSLEGVLSFNRFGQAESLLMDPPGAPEGHRTEITQALLLTRIPSALAPARVRFLLSLEPRSP